MPTRSWNEQRPLLDMAESAVGPLSHSLGQKVPEFVPFANPPGRLISITVHKGTCDNQHRRPTRHFCWGAVLSLSVLQDTTRVVNRLAKLVREPLAQFVLIGACIYGAYAMFSEPNESAGEWSIVVDENRIEGFIAAWERRWNRPPTREELDAIIRQFVREEILYREAVAMGLDKDDPVTRRRMAQKIEFLTKDVLRLKEPGEQELEQYFMDNLHRYQKPDFITFTQVFLDPDKRGEKTLDDAANLLAELQAAGEPDPEAPHMGDRLMLQGYFPVRTELDIRRQFGMGFSEAVMELQPGRWHGPIPSGYGVHLVYVHSIEVSPPPVFSQVRDRVLEDWQYAQQEKAYAQFLENLENRYEIVVEGVPAAAGGDSRSGARAQDMDGRKTEPQS